MRYHDDADVPDGKVQLQRVHGDRGQRVVAHHAERLVVDVEKRHDAQRAHGHAQLYAEQAVQAADRLAYQPVPDPQRFDRVGRGTARPVRRIVAGAAANIGAADAAAAVVVVVSAARTLQVPGEVHQRPGVELDDLAVDLPQLAVQRETVLGELRLRAAHAQVLHETVRVQRDDRRVRFVRAQEPVQLQRVHRHGQSDAHRHGRQRERLVAPHVRGRGRRVRLVALQQLLVPRELVPHAVQKRHPRERGRHVQHARVDFLQDPYRLGRAFHPYFAYDGRYEEEQERARDQ